jgi:hypothetical protein
MALVSAGGELNAWVATGVDTRLFYLMASELAKKFPSQRFLPHHYHSRFSADLPAPNRMNLLPPFYTKELEAATRRGEP